MRIGIVNDTPFAVIALRRTLAMRPENRVVWVAENGQRAVEQCAKDTPDLVLMDLIMPVMDGVEATRQIMANSPCAILIVTASVGTNAARVFEAMGHGALDAVNTPVLGMADPGVNAAPFLTKIEIIGKLIRDKQPRERAAPPEPARDASAGDAAQRMEPPASAARPEPAGRDEPDRESRSRDAAAREFRRESPVERPGRPLAEPPARIADAPLRTVALRGGSRLVAIGASAGGPTALGIVLRGLPKDFPGAVVVVQHVDEQFASGMAEWLGNHSAMPVRVAQEGDALTPGTVLLAGTINHLKLKRADRLGYTPDPRDLPYRPSVDVFFQSVSDLWAGDVIGVLLTGMGKDGAHGLKALRDKGHYTIAQDRATSAVYGMPKAAATLDAAVDIMPINRIAPKLIEVFTQKS